jgi:transcription elongation GreA/GreB family factor
MDKHALIAALCESLEAEIARAIESAERTRAGAIHEEARPENDKDTRALEASYLARGQAQRVVDLQQALKLARFMEVRAFGPDDAIGISALVQLQSERESRWYFLAPSAGGRRLRASDDTSVDVITPEAPLGRALAGRFVGDEFVMRAGGRAVEWEIREVR